MTQVTCRLTAKNRDQLQNPMLSNRVWATFFNISVCNFAHDSRLAPAASLRYRSMKSRIQVGSKFSRCRAISFSMKQMIDDMLVRADRNCTNHGHGRIANESVPQIITNNQGYICRGVGGVEHPAKISDPPCCY